MVFRNLRRFSMTDDAEWIRCSRCPQTGLAEGEDIRPTMLIVNGLCYSCWLEDCQAEEVESLLP